MRLWTGISVENYWARRLVPFWCSLALFVAVSGCSQKAADTSSTASRPQAVVLGRSELVAAPAAPAQPVLTRQGTDSRGFAQAVIAGGQCLLVSRQILPVDREGRLAPGGEPPGRWQSQVEQLLANLEALLNENGSGWDKLVRVHGYVANPQAAGVLVEGLAKRIPDGQRPALALVETPLPLGGADLAVDVLAISAENVDVLTLRRSAQIWGEEGFADVALVPVSGLAFFSGYPEKGEPAEAASKSLAGLLELGQQLGVVRADIAFLKVFAQPVGLSEVVKTKLRSVFADQLVPPVAYVEWIASAPVEIEMIAVLRTLSALQDGKIRFYNPPGVKPSPTFTRVVLTAPGVYAFTGGVTAEQASDGTGEVRAIFEDLGNILREIGSDFRHLIKATYYVSGKESSTALDKLRPEYFDPSCPPAASKVTVHGVAVPDRSIVVDMIALVRD